MAIVLVNGTEPIIDLLSDQLRSHYKHLWVLTLEIIRTSTMWWRVKDWFEEAREGKRESEGILDAWEVLEGGVRLKQEVVSQGGKS